MKDTLCALLRGSLAALSIQLIACVAADTPYGKFGAAFADLNNVTLDANGLSIGTAEVTGPMREGRKGLADIVRLKGYLEMFKVGADVLDSGISTAADTWGN